MIKQRIESIISYLNEDMHERKEIIAVSLLAALADQNIFLLGPPGTAKSLISRRLSKAFKTNSYFEYLMQRFSTPEEVFGPVSISELKKDNYVRKIDGYLPNAEFAFLDEIWKSGPAILNALLTIINEKIFRNGDRVHKVPLKILISASNETPPYNQGLEALYDRFLIRLYVPPIKSKTNFNILLKSQPTPKQIELSEETVIKPEELIKWSDEIKSVELSKDTLNIIHDIKLFIDENGEELGIYVSDRRWQKAAYLLKAAAYFCERKSTNIVDSLLLRHCLWSTEKNRAKVQDIIENAVRNSGFDTDINIHSLDQKKEALENEINKELFYSEDIYETYTLGKGSEYFKVKLENIEDPIYLDVEKFKSKSNFKPVCPSGNTKEGLNCNFDGQGTCTIEYKHYHRSTKYTFTPKVLFYKGDRKKNINNRLIESLKSAINELEKNIKDSVYEIEQKYELFQKELYSPFVEESKRKIAVESIYQQLDSMNLRLEDCKRLIALIG